MRRALHLAAERELPRFAAATFRRWARRQGVPDAGDAPAAARSLQRRPAASRALGRYIQQLLPPEDQRVAACEVLGAAGFQRGDSARSSLLRPATLRLRHARRGRRRTCGRSCDGLGDGIDAGCPLVVLEPSCASVFRDELRGLFPDNPRAERLRRQTFRPERVPDALAPDYAPPLPRKVLLHGHCHQKAIIKMDHEVALLQKMGAELHVPDAGCCGMAGPFGFARRQDRGVESGWRTRAAAGRAPIVAMTR